MLQAALKFLTDQLNGFLRTRAGATSDIVTLSRVVNPAGQYAFEEEHICINLINIEEDRVFKSHLPDQNQVDGRYVVLEPELKLNLHVLAAANFKQYDVGLRYLSLLLTFFQSHPAFNGEEYGTLHAGIKKLVVELQSLTFEQLNQVWAFVGAKHLPSVVYKVRMVALQDMAPAEVRPAISRIDAKLGGR